MHLAFRPYSHSDLQVCLDIFDTNCPEYLAPDEREDYLQFLDEQPPGYEVCELESRVVAAFGLSGSDEVEIRLDWIMVDGAAQGIGIGARIMDRVLRRARRLGRKSIGLSTSQKVAPFFARYGATTIASSKDGYGPGLDQVDMVLPLNSRQSVLSSWADGKQI